MFQPYYDCKDSTTLHDMQNSNNSYVRTYVSYVCVERAPQRVGTKPPFKVARFNSPQRVLPVIPTINFHETPLSLNEQAVVAAMR